MPAGLTNIDAILIYNFDQQGIFIKYFYMIATLKKPDNFQEVLRHNLDWVSKKEAVILDHSFASLSAKSILREVEMIKCLRPNLNRFFYCISIDFSRQKNLTTDLLKEVCFEYLQLNGFLMHLYIMFKYDDVDHIRVNIIVTRIGFDGKVNSDSHDHSRSEKALSQLRGRYNIRK